MSKKIEDEFDDDMDTHCPACGADLWIEGHELECPHADDEEDYNEFFGLEEDETEELDFEEDDDFGEEDNDGEE